MPVINAKDLEVGEKSFIECSRSLRDLGLQIRLDDENVTLRGQASQKESQKRTDLVLADTPQSTLAMAVRFSLFLLERHAPGEGVEVRVAPWGAVKILDGPRSDPHNLTPPDVIELEPWVWLRLASGTTTWDEEKKAGHITAVGKRDDLSALLPLVTAK
jgi:hypothetical protein